MTAQAPIGNLAGRAAMHLPALHTVAAIHCYDLFTHPFMILDINSQVSRIFTPLSVVQDVEGEFVVVLLRRAVEMIQYTVDFRSNTPYINCYCSRGPAFVWSSVVRTGPDRRGPVLVVPSASCPVLPPG